MAHVRKIKDGKFECVWSFPGPDGRRKFQSKRFPTKAEADQHKRNVENRNATGLSTDHKPGKQPFAVAANSWIDFKEQSLKPSTARQYRSILKSTVLPFFGHRQLASITPKDVREYVTALSKSGRAAPTIRRHHTVLLSVLKQAAEDGDIPRNVASGVGLPTDKSTGRIVPQPVFLSEADVTLLAAQLPEPYDLLVRFLAYTGLRVGEASGLNIEDVNLGAKKPISVERTRSRVKGEWIEHSPKTGKRRVVPILDPVLRDRMAAYLDAHPNRDIPTAPLFPGTTLHQTKRVSGSHRVLVWDRPWEPGVFRKRQFNAALVSAGLPPMRLHDLRHTAASIMLHRGVPPYRVAEYLGHSLQVLTTVYAHIMPDAVDDDAALFAAPRRGLRAV